MCEPSHHCGLWLIQGDAGTAGCAKTIDRLLSLGRIGLGNGVEMRDIISLPGKGWGGRGQRHDHTRKKLYGPDRFGHPTHGESPLNCDSSI